MRLWELADLIDDRVLRHRLWPVCDFVANVLAPRDDPFSLYADNARDFLERLANPEPLTPEQRALYAGAMKAYEESMAGERSPGCSCDGSEEDKYCDWN